LLIKDEFIDDLSAYFYTFIVGVIDENIEYSFYFFEDSSSFLVLPIIVVVEYHHLQIHIIFRI